MTRSFGSNSKVKNGGIVDVAAWVLDGFKPEKGRLKENSNKIKMKFQHSPIRAKSLSIWEFKSPH
ncbi:hypothetical protein A7Q02_05120 [Eikenella sp. NML97-A-109]|nr:hypothetical protein A7Q02_05120 [Eikenella sp. NML97-A-109]